jgi:hypothetical protein
VKVPAWPYRLIGKDASLSSWKSRVQFPVGLKNTSKKYCRTFNEVPKVRILHHPYRDPWCNGSTSGFGPGGQGSNPCGSNNATLAQTVEQLPCKHPVVRSNRTGGYVTVAEWLMRLSVEQDHAGSNPVGHHRG